MTQAEALERMRTGMNRLRGRLFALIETTGMPAEQQAAFKSLVRQLTYDEQASLEAILRGDE